MRQGSWIVRVAVALVLLGLCARPTMAVTTFWNFLGIPQAFNKVTDARSNRFGNHPARERVPALKRIGDPANLESKNPAIKTAAQIKNEEDLKRQKIKAIKYLGDIGCGCYPGVKEALLAALDDCTPEVRLAAAQALREAAGNICRTCGQSCCDAEVRTKLADVAFGLDDTGCFKEVSADVRQAASQALRACGGPPVPAEPVQTPIREVPVTPEGGREVPTAPIPPVSTPASKPAASAQYNPVPAPVARPQAVNRQPATLAQPKSMVTAPPPRRPAVINSQPTAPVQRPAVNRAPQTVRSADHGLTQSAPRVPMATAARAPQPRASVRVNRAAAPTLAPKLTPAPTPARAAQSEPTDEVPQGVRVTVAPRRVAPRAMPAGQTSKQAYRGFSGQNMPGVRQTNYTSGPNGQ